MILLTENKSVERIEQIRLLYESAFPPDERMPFERVLQKCEPPLPPKRLVHDLPYEAKDWHEQQY